MAQSKSDNRGTNRHSVTGWKGAIRAFSLIEVVIAIGVVAFALLGIVSLVPEGLMQVRTAEDMQATSNIANQLRGQFQMLSFSDKTTTGANTLSQLLATNYYYSIEGLPAGSTGFYKASFALAGGVSGGSALNLAGSTVAQGNAVSILVTLTYPPVSSTHTNAFSLLVARQTDN